MSARNGIIVALGTIVLAAVSFGAAVAQSNDAAAEAESTCTNHGVAPTTAAFDTCVSRVASALDRGQPALADREAALVRDADDRCRSYGIAAATLGYRACVNSEIARRSSSYQAQAGPASSAPPTPAPAAPISAAPTPAAPGQTAPASISYDSGGGVHYDNGRQSRTRP